MWPKSESEELFTNHCDDALQAAKYMDTDDAVRKEDDQHKSVDMDQVQGTTKDWQSVQKYKEES